MILVIYLLIINLFTFIIYGMDLRKQQRGKTKITRTRLLFLAAIGGPLGIVLGMLVFHHKVKKKLFYYVVFLFTGLWCIVCAFCLYQNYHIIVTKYEYKSGFDCRIVQISDLHNQFFGMNQGRLVEEMNEVNECIQVPPAPLVREICD